MGTFEKSHAYASLMQAIEQCPDCGRPVLATVNRCLLDPSPIVDASEPGSMTLMFIDGGVTFAASGQKGQACHRLHEHQRG
jgi:hypothetical protein